MDDPSRRAGPDDGAPRYTTVLFDLIDTLVRFDPAKLPIVTIGGRELRSSVAKLYPVARGSLPGVTLEAFYQAFAGSYQEVERRRATDHREVPARERFRLVYGALGIAPDTVPEALTDRLLSAHMACLADAAEPMSGRLELLDWLAGRFRLGIISNFDYTPTVERILKEAGLRERFATVVVSDTVGWRKPCAAIFEAAFALLAVGPGECLFVGDRPEIDVLGAKEAGMHTAWLNPDGVPLPDGLPRPDLELRGLGDLRAILETAGRKVGKRA